MISKKITVQARRVVDDNIVTNVRMESENSHVITQKTELLFIPENPAFVKMRIIKMVETNTVVTKKDIGIRNDT